MHRPDPDVVAQQLAEQAIGSGTPTAWYEQLYQASARGEVDVPWDRHAPHPQFVEWLGERRGDARTAVVVGCGSGDDAALLADHGFVVTAFDISPAAIELARGRYPSAGVTFTVADLLALPHEWRQGFDFVLESMTVQSMPESLRAGATAGVASLVAPGGLLLVLAAGRRPEHPVAGPPWPLTPAQLEAFGAEGLTPVHVERLAPTRPGHEFRWRAEFTRP